MKLSETIDKILFNYSLVMAQSEFREKAIAEILSALASQPDDELLLTDDEIRTRFNDGFGDENYQRYIYQLGLHKQDAVNLARFGAGRQLAKVQPVITALRAKLAEAEAKIKGTIYLTSQ